MSHSKKGLDPSLRQRIITNWTRVANPQLFESLTAALLTDAVFVYRGGLWGYLNCDAAP